MNDAEPLKRVALVAGGSSGIGLACAARLAAVGQTVVIGGRSQRRLDEAGARLRQDGVEAGTVTVDVGDDASAEAAVAEVLERYGRLDVLVCSVGSAPAGFVDEVDTGQWLAALDTKVIGAVRLIRAAVPSMRRQNYGRIVAIAGTAGREPDPWMVVAGSANAALVNVVNAAARQLAPDGVTVNAVCPGPTRTGRWAGLVSSYARFRGLAEDEAQVVLESRIPTGRPAEPHDVAELVAYIASERAAHLNGTAIALDGGESRTA